MTNWPTAHLTQFDWLLFSLTHSSLSIVKPKRRISAEMPSCKGDFGVIPRNTIVWARDGRSKSSLKRILLGTQHYRLDTVVHLHLKRSRLLAYVADKNQSETSPHFSRKQDFRWVRRRPTPHDSGG